MQQMPQQREASMPDMAQVGSVEKMVTDHLSVSALIRAYQVLVCKKVRNDLRVNNMLSKHETNLLSSGSWASHRRSGSADAGIYALRVCTTGTRAG